MTASAITMRALRLPLRLIGFVVNLVVGALLCLTPGSSVIVLGWLARKMSAATRRRWGEDPEQAGWLLGPREAGWITYLLGGLAANIRVGLKTVAGLVFLSLPFSALWLGAWWAGWENSFNKGYEQAAVGPSVWLVGAAIAVVVLAHLPFALAHAAVEGRLGAFFELRRIRSIVAAAGWRGPWLALLSIAVSLPFLGARALPVFIENIVPGFAEMSAEQQVNIAGLSAMLTSAYGFTALWFLRAHTASIYAIAAPRAAAGPAAALWSGHKCAAIAGQTRPVSRFLAAIWLTVSCVIWFGLVVQIVIGQFMNYDPFLWLTHPMYLLPWFG